MKLPRSLAEAWLFKATRTELPSWQRALLLRALREDPTLRLLALELTEFNSGPAPEQGPDFLPWLRVRRAEDDDEALERPLFPSGWIPAGAIAALLITGLVALAVHPPEKQSRTEAEAQASATALALESPAPVAPAAAPAAGVKAFVSNANTPAARALSGSAATPVSPTAQRSSLP